MNQFVQIVLQNKIAFLLLYLWVLPWKGVALWKAARLRDNIWFILILILNTLAVLEIIYIFVICKRKGLMAKQGF
jgi:hypothetical protein